MDGKRQAVGVRVRRRLAWLALAATLLAATVVMLGAYTRLQNAGLGCPDWPGCYGFLHVPDSARAIAVAEARFPGDPVQTSKGWPEMIHRYFAGTLGLLVFAMLAYALRHRNDGAPWRQITAIAALVVLQAAFGMWTVTLKLWPQVVAAHLLGGFATLSLLFLLRLRLCGRRLNPAPDAQQALARVRPWLILALALVCLQIALGAWTTANYAGYACPDFPGCQGQLWPRMNMGQGFDLLQTIGPNYLGGHLGNSARMAIHMSHRLGALAVLLVLGAVLVRLWVVGQGTGLRRWTGVAAAMLAVQILLGIANVMLGLPLVIAEAHNAMGAGLLLSVINLLWRLYGCKRRLPAPLQTMPRTRSAREAVI